MEAKYRLTEVSEEALLVNLKRCVGSENEITALVLAHLAEIDARGAYRQSACATLVSYCVYELRLSEDEAQRRCRAARVARQFPILFEMLADASIHLTGIVLLAPHLTQENHAELLARARYRTKRELEKLLAQVAPRADVPNVIEPLGPANDGFRRPAPSTYSSMVYGVAGYVRHLTPGNDPSGAPSAPHHWLEAPVAGGAAEGVSEPAVPDQGVATRAAELAAPDPDVAFAPDLRAPMRYRVQFTADQTYVDLLERARDLLEHQIPNRELAAVQRLAIEALVETLTRRKYGGIDTGARRGPRLSENAYAESTKAPTPSATTSSESTSSESTPSESTPSTPSTPSIASAPSSAGRHLPAALRRSVAQRDGGRCTYVDSRGVRCRETARLEFHHEHAHARGGPTSVDNIMLRCRAHNDLAAEHDFGRLFMERKKRREPPVSSAPARNGEAP